MGKKVTLTESDLIKMIQQIVKENKSSEMDEQLFASKRRRALNSILFHHCIIHFLILFQFLELFVTQNQ